MSVPEFPLKLNVIDLEPRDPKEPNFEDPIVLAVINDAGDYHIFSILNSGKVCLDFWEEEIHILNTDAISSHPELTNVVVQMRLHYESYRSFNGEYEEYDGDTTFEDEKSLWKYNPHYDSDTLMRGTQPQNDDGRAILKDIV